MEENSQKVPAFNEFCRLVRKYEYQPHKLVFIVFPFGAKGSELENKWPRDWQLERWKELSDHLMNPETRYKAYLEAISTGNGPGKTAYGAMTTIMLLYAFSLRGRVAANTEKQTLNVIWKEYLLWLRRARFNEDMFSKAATTIEAKKTELKDKWRIDTLLWDKDRPFGISGFHNEGGAIIQVFEEAAGIPEVIWRYSEGAYSDKDTIKIHLAFANSDDPRSYFERVIMKSKYWRTLRIDCRDLDFMDQDEIARKLESCGGDEDHDHFRVTVRGLPRKSSRDSIYSYDLVRNSLNKGRKQLFKTYSHLPVVLSCDPGWRRDHTSIWVRCGPLAIMLDYYVLDQDDNHAYTYYKLCDYEKQYKADYVNLDHGEGTGLYSMAQNEGKYWEVFAFGAGAYDAPTKDSEFMNLKTQIYCLGERWMRKGGMIKCMTPGWEDIVQDEFTWTKYVLKSESGKKLAQTKAQIREENQGKSPDTLDAFALTFARPALEKLYDPDEAAGSSPIILGGDGKPYDPYKGLY